jgi:hypothetical protein
VDFTEGFMNERRHDGRALYVYLLKFATMMKK